MFAEPWQAQVFALAVALSAGGTFTWPQWSHALGDTIAAAPDRDYWECWLATLERLLEARSLADPGALAALESDWARAYRETPHGRPVEL